MKKWIKTALLSVGAAALMCGGAFAADASTSGVYDVTPESGYTLTPQTADKTAVPAEKAQVNGKETQFYADAVRFELTGTGTNGTQYVVFALSGEKAVPTKSNIAYIDQDAASNGTISFNLYPGSLSSGTYNVYLAAGGGNGLEKVAAFSYYQAYTLGDVDGDQLININDAMAILNHLVEKDGCILTGSNYLAADINGDSTVNINDAMELLNFLAGKSGDYLKNKG
ncbi:dockerin type I repeat-containing protein [uncultured Agathobaculum sp.]|uniref:dockerin type I repeat-containing protein n=1 Tax=uncultured Agathobaculum sp. TaxID=2048140 RepID=UPI00296FD78C